MTANGNGQDLSELIEKLQYLKRTDPYLAVVLFIGQNDDNDK